jgi:hypothetical protein
MRCVNHPETEAQSYCQHCGKALCAACVRTTASGQIFCETCQAAGAASNPAQGAWAGATYQGQPIPGFAIPLHGGPNPAAAAVLGLIPGVGAMYNGQLFKGLIHVVIFAVLISITEHYGVFGIFIGAWCLYQSFEAFHTAKARRDGTPLPDPFGLNELGSWLNLGSASRFQGTHQNPEQPPSAGGSSQSSAQTSGQGSAGAEPPPYSAPYSSSWSNVNPGPGPAAGYPPQPPYAEPYVSPDPYGGSYPPGYVPPIPPIPPIPPVPPQYWRRREPIFAFVLIGLGVIFLLQSLGFVSHLMHYMWPILLIGLGVWLIVRRVGYMQGGSK